MAYYVTGSGRVFTYEIHSPTTIKLSNGAILDDPPPGKMFATELSANKYAELVREFGVEIARVKHIEWVGSLFGDKHGRRFFLGDDE